MGNPSIRLGASNGPAPPSTNGILARVPGQFISAGSKQLPPAGAHEQAERQTVLPDVPDLGAVRITYRLNRYKHGRSWHWHWVAVRADPDNGAGVAA